MNQGQNVSFIIFPDNSDNLYKMGKGFMGKDGNLFSSGLAGATGRNENPKELKLNGNGITNPY